MYSVRLKFEKLGAAAYISHLDLMQTLQRAMTRTDLPVKYSQGFNPHIYLSILAPISTGFESVCEMCDFDLSIDQQPEDILNVLNLALPSGIRALEAYQSTRPLKEIQFAQYEIKYENCDSFKMSEYFQKGIFVVKESKRQTREILINQYIKSISFGKLCDGAVCKCVLNLGEDQLNPIYVTKALKEGKLIEPNSVPQYKRTALFDKNLEIFK